MGRRQERGREQANSKYRTVFHVYDPFCGRTTAFTCRAGCKERHVSETAMSASTIAGSPALAPSSNARIRGLLGFTPRREIVPKQTVRLYCHLVIPYLALVIAG